MRSSYLPGTCCHWKTVRTGHSAAVGRVSRSLRPSMVSMKRNIRDFPLCWRNRENRILRPETLRWTYLGDYGCSLGGSLWGCWRRGRIFADYGILGSSDLDQASPIAAKLQTNLTPPLVIHAYSRRTVSRVDCCKTPHAAKVGKKWAVMCKRSWRCSAAHCM